MRPKKCIKRSVEFPKANFWVACVWIRLGCHIWLPCEYISRHVSHMLIFMEKPASVSLFLRTHSDKVCSAYALVSHRNILREYKCFFIKVQPNFKAFHWNFFCAGFVHSISLSIVWKCMLIPATFEHFKTIANKKFSF